MQGSTSAYVIALSVGIEKARAKAIIRELRAAGCFPSPARARQKLTAPKKRSVPVKKSPGGCGRCGLRGAHVCIDSVSIAGERRYDK